MATRNKTKSKRTDSEISSIERILFRSSHRIRRIYSTILRNNC